MLYTFWNTLDIQAVAIQGSSNCSSWLILIEELMICHWGIWSAISCHYLRSRICSSISDFHDKTAPAIPQEEMLSMSCMAVANEMRW